jgi:hypothetical protein
MNNLIEKLYEESAEFYDTSQQELFFTSQKARLIQLDRDELLLALFAKGNFEGFILDFLMYSQWIWNQMSLLDWTRLMLKIPRDRIKYPLHNSGNYMDLVFLSNRIGINAIDVLLSNPLNEKNKSDIIISVNVMKYQLLKLDELEKNELFYERNNNNISISNTMLNENDFISYKNILMIQGAKDGFNNVKEFDSYINTLEIKFENKKLD